MSYVPRPKLLLSHGVEISYDDLSVQEKHSLEAITHAITIPYFRESHINILQKFAREGDLDAQNALTLIEHDW